LGVPFALGVLVFDCLAAPWLALLGSGAAGSVERFLVGGKAFREHPVDRVGPAIVVADHLVSDVYHRLHLRSCTLPSVKSIPGSCPSRLRPLPKTPARIDCRL